MRSSSEDVKSHVKQWLTGGFERGKSCNDPRPATSVYNQDKTDDEYEEAREETEDYLLKEPMEQEDMAKDHDRCDQKTDLDKASYPKIQDTDLNPQRAATGSRTTMEGMTAQKTEISLTANSIPILGHMGDDKRDKHSQSGQIVDSGQGPTPPPESPCKSDRGGDRRDEQRQFDRIGSKREKDNVPRTVKEIPEIGRGTASKHPSPQRNMPGRTDAPPFVAPAHPHKGKKEERQSPRSSCCIVL